ncbi:hypothetical protein D3C84_747330 [compost metagenome]
MAIPEQLREDFAVVEHAGMGPLIRCARAEGDVHLLAQTVVVSVTGDDTKRLLVERQQPALASSHPRLVGHALFEGRRQAAQLGLVVKRLAPGVIGLVQVFQEQVPGALDTQLQVFQVCLCGVRQAVLAKLPEDLCQGSFSRRREMLGYRAVRQVLIQLKQVGMVFERPLEILQPFAAVRPSLHPGVTYPVPAQLLQHIAKALQAGVNLVHRQHEVVPGGERCLGLDDLGDLSGALGKNPVEGR